MNYPEAELRGILLIKTHMNEEQMQEIIIEPKGEAGGIPVPPC